jgi:hypothetical protein
MDQKTWDFSCRKVFVWFTDGSRTMEGTGDGVYGQSLGRRHSISLEKHATVFQTTVYAILACVYEIQMNVSPEKCVSICCVSHAGLKALQVATTTSPLVRRCWGTRRRNLCQARKRRFCSAPSLRVSKQNIKRTIKRWVNNQHLARRSGLVQEQGSLDPVSDYGVQRICFKN